jgi:hypothetical protein
MHFNSLIFIHGRSYNCSNVGVYGTNEFPFYSMINAMLFIHTVLHMLDWQRALSNLTKTIAVIQIKQSNCEEKRAMVTEMSNAFMCVLALMNALLDAISSVAASVVFSRLLISGDVESNPGPGRYAGELLSIISFTTQFPVTIKLI